MSKIKLRIHTWPEKILKKKCKKVRKVDNKIRELLSEMLSLMQVNGGLGLAANQVGLNLRLITIEAKDRTFKLVNPHILKKEGSICIFEGCLSFPGLELEVKRAAKVWVSAQDETGKLIELEVEGVLAIVFQHEIDHIKGNVFIDKIHFWQKLKIAPQLKAIIRKTKNRISAQEEKH